MILPAALVWSLALAAPQRLALLDVRLDPAEDAGTVSILVEDGRIRGVLGQADSIPPGYRIVEGEGRLALPAFVDAYTHAGCETPEPVVDQDVPPDTAADVEIAMRAANRKGIQPSFRAVRALALREKIAGDWRERGFGALASAPHGELLAGTSVLATTADRATRDVVIAPDLFAHAAFHAGGSGGYPSTLMGYHAQLRQFFLDAARHAEVGERARTGRGERAPYDPELERGVAILSGERLWCEAESAADIRRWLRLGDELGFEVGITGGREAWELADELAARGVPVILTLDWGEEVPDPSAKDKDKDKDKDKEEPEGQQSEDEPSERPESDAPVDEPVDEPGDEPDSDADPPSPPRVPDAPDPDADTDSEADVEAEDAEEDEDEDAPRAAADDEPWIYVEPFAVRAERRRLWEQGRDCALRLEEAGVTYAFGSGGADAKKLLERVRALVAAGLARDAALAGLTTRAAGIVGATDALGAIESDRDATFALWTADPLGPDGKRAKLAGICVDGHWYRFELDDDAPAEGEPADGADASGAWTFRYEVRGQRVELAAELSMEADGTVSGNYEQMALDGSTARGPLEGRVVERTLTLTGRLAMGETTAEFEFEGTLGENAFQGDVSIQSSFGDFELPATGTRAEPDSERDDARGSGFEHDHFGDPDDCCNPAREVIR